MASLDDLRIDTPPSKPGGRLWWPGLLAVAALVAMAWFGYMALPISSNSPDEADKHVETTTSEPRPVAADGGFTAGGYLEVIPPGPTIVAARVEGPVLTVEVIEGQAVEAGAVLVRLDDALHRQELAEAEAAVRLAQAKADLMRSGFRSEEIAEAAAKLRSIEARWQQARAEVQRNERQVAIGGLPERTLEASRAALEALEAEVAEARSRLEMRQAGARVEEIAVAEAEHAAALARLERARWRIAACVVRAPASGVVMERFVQPGQWVTPAGERGLSHGSALLTLADPGHIQAWVEVNQRDAGRVFEGQPVSIISDALRGRSIRGRVARILPMANLQRNTIHLKIEVLDPPTGLRPEMSVQVSFAPVQRTAGEPGEDTLREASGGR